MPMVALCDWRSSKGIRRCTRTSPTSARDTDTTRTKSASRNVVAMSPTMSHILAISRSYAGDSGPGLWTSAKHYLEVSGAVLRRMVGDAAGGMRVSETNLAIKSATHEWNWRGREIGRPGLHQPYTYAVCELAGSGRDGIFCHRYSTYTL